MPSPTKQMPLTARALDQLDAQVADADNNEKLGSIRPSSADSTNTSNKMEESDKARSNLESEMSRDSRSNNNINIPSQQLGNSLHNPQDPSAPVPLMTDHIVDGTIYRSPDTLHTLITVRPTPSKGLAVFALQDLAPHTLLLSERPLVALNDNGARVDPLDTLVNALPPPLKHAYRSLHAGTTTTTTTTTTTGGGSSTTTATKNARPRPRPRESLNRRVLYSNGFAIQRTTTAVFEIASRINHSCVPNARFRWDEATGRMDYYTVRKVLEGEEVCIDYGHTKGRLLKYYGFECACGGCTDWGSVTSSGGAAVAAAAGGSVEGGSADGDGEVDGYNVRLVQADGLWRPAEIAKIAAAAAGKEEADATMCLTTKVDEMDDEKENLRPEGIET